jgi:hypothetical protein
VQTLILVALHELLPEPCEKLRITNEDIRDRYGQEFEKRKEAVRQDIAKAEDSLRRGLREVVVEDVLKLFPYVYQRRHMWHSGNVSSRCRSFERDNLSVSVEDSGDTNASQEAAGRVFPHPVLTPSHGFSGAMWLSGLDSLYPGFRAIYQKHFDNARFDIALRLDSRFESKKLRLLSARYLLDRNQKIDTEARADLIGAVLEGNFRRAVQTLNKTDEKKGSGLSAWPGRSLFSGSGEGSLEKEMKTLTARTSDSHFLFLMKSEGVEELRPVIKDVEELAYAQLKVSIDATVKTMARAVSAMQQQQCEKSIQHEMESQERKARRKVLAKFIQDINAQTVGRQEPYDSLSMRRWKSDGTYDSVVYLDSILVARSIGSRDR